MHTSYFLGLKSNMANWFLLIQNAFQELQDSKSFLVHHVSRTLSLWKDHRLDILSYTLIIIETRLKSYHIMGLMRENLLIPIYFIIGRMPLSALLPLLMHLASSFIRQILILEKLKCKAPAFLLFTGINFRHCWLPLILLSQCLVSGCQAWSYTH